jgi:hypothetical protein
MKRTPATNKLGPAWSWLSWADLVAISAGDELAAELDEDDIDFVLWNQTAFPFADVGTVYAQLSLWWLGKYDDPVRPAYGYEDEPPEAELAGWAELRWGELYGLVRRLHDGRDVAVVPFLFTWAVIVGRDIAGSSFYDDRWCYRSSEAAIRAATLWDGTGEPEGWHRHPFSGRRRENGDPATEVVRD